MAEHIVRYGAMRFLGVFTAGSGSEYRRGMKVITQTDRGLEAGEVLCESTERALAHLADPAEGQIVREMTPDDANELSRIREWVPEIIAT